MSEEHDQVEVPENAIRDDPIAFGLTAPQIGLAGAAAAVAFVLNLLPIWLPLARFSCSWCRSASYRSCSKGRTR